MTQAAAISQAKSDFQTLVRIVTKCRSKVQTGASRSVSYTFVYQTKSSQALARTRAFNHCLRELGIAPSRPGVHRGADAAKALTMRAAVPLHLAVRLIDKLRPHS